MKILNYDNKLKKLSFSDIEFTPVSTAKVKAIFYDEQLTPEPDSMGFKNMLLEVLSEEVEKDVLKYSILFTPKQPKYDGLGFLYLSDRTILPIKIEASKNYQDWHKVMTKGSAFLKSDEVDWLIHVSKGGTSSRGEGMSHEFNGQSFGFEDRALYKEAGKYLHDNAPKKFNLKKIASEKRSYLKKYLQIDGEGLSFDFEAFKAALSFFDEKLILSILDLTNFKASFLAQTGFELPASIACLYACCNGSVEAIKGGYSILNVDQLLEAWEQWKSIFDEWTLGELKVHESDENKTLPMYTTPYWIPFMSDGNGNYIAVDLAPGKKGQAGQIITFGADEDTIKVLADDMQVFFEAIQNENNPLTNHV